MMGRVGGSAGALVGVLIDVRVTDLVVGLLGEGCT